MGEVNDCYGCPFLKQESRGWSHGVPHYTCNMKKYKDVVVVYGKSDKIPSECEHRQFIGLEKGGE